MPAGTRGRCLDADSTREVRGQPRDPRDALTCATTTDRVEHNVTRSPNRILSLAPLLVIGRLRSGVCMKFPTIVIEASSPSCESLATTNQFDPDKYQDFNIAGDLKANLAPARPSLVITSRFESGASSDQRSTTSQIAQCLCRLPASPTSTSTTHTSSSKRIV